MQLSAISLAITRIGRIGFSPLSLFAAGEQGAWYDPSDLTTMFQDRVGTTPVTADGQTVGMILDKSKGLALGAETIGDYDFNTPASWTPQNATWVVSGGKATYTKIDTSVYYLQNNVGVVLTAGKSYKLTFVLSGATPGINSVIFGLFNQDATENLLGGYLIFAANGTYNYIFKPAATTTSIRIYGNGGGSSPSWSLDSFSLKEIAGNHATAPSDAARPLYKTSAGKHWMQFDGVDDNLSTAVVNKSGWTGGICVVGHVANSGAGGVFCGAEGTLSTLSNHEPFTDTKWYFAFGTATRVDLAGTLSYGTNYVTTRVRDATNTTGRINGSQVATAVSATDFNGSSALIVGNGRKDLNLGGAFLGNIYSLIVRGALSTAQEITDTETWVNGKTGAY